MRTVVALILAGVLGCVASTARAVDLSETMVDLSEYNDFDKVAALAAQQDIELLMLRATLGVGDDDRRFRERVGRTLALGLKVGAYHALYPTHAGDEQARYFVKQVAAACPKGAKILLAADWETPTTPGGAPYPIADASTVTTFLAQVKALTGKTPMVYTSPRIIAAKRADIGADMAGADLWLSTTLTSVMRSRDCKKSPDVLETSYLCTNAVQGLIMPFQEEYSPWRDWTFWQFSEGQWQDEAAQRRYAVGGLPVDVSFFAGGRDAFHRYFDDHAWTCDPAVGAGL